MRQGQISVYYGAGKGKTAVAVGRGMRAIGEDLRVVMIQFLDYHNSKEIALLKKLEPDFRIFRFEKDRDCSEVVFFYHGQQQNGQQQNGQQQNGQQ